MHNWVEIFDLRCASGVTIGNFGSFFFAGLGIGTFFLAHLPDAYGRIKILRYGLTISVVLLSMIVFVTVNIYLTYTLIFIYGFVSPVRLNLSFIYSAESFKDKHSPIMGSLSLSFDAFTYIITILYFSQVSKYWMPLFYFYIGVACIPTFICYILPESPRYLMSRHMFTEARESFNKIASMNQQTNLC